MLDKRPYGQRFRERRRQLGLTQAQVASRLGVSQAAIASFERKKDHGTRWATLERYATALDTTAQELFGED